MDLGTLSNKIYLDTYKTYAEIWKDVGYVFKNCRLYNTVESSDVRILGDTLREYARILYKQWHRIQLERYDQMMTEINSKKQEYIEANPEESTIIQKEVTDEESQFKERLDAVF